MMMRGMLSLDEALEVVLARVPAPTATRAVPVPLAEAVGRVLARDVVAGGDLPPFARSTMDGFAVRAADTPAGVRLPVVAESAAGRPAAVALGPGEAIRIFTGAELPAGADAVIMVERTEPAGAAAVWIQDAVRPGQNVARQGEDLRAGEVALAAGRAIGTGDVGLLASLGAVAPVVFAPPRVAILATGTELVAPDRVPGPGCIRESNGAALAALVRAAGCVTVPLELVADDADRIRARAAAGLQEDVLLLSGGSSVGDYDFTPRVLAELAVQVHFDRVALKPGKPTLFGTRGEQVVFGLPGNPISAFVVFHLLVRPALVRRAGLAAAAPLRFRARLAAPVRRVRARDQVLPAAARPDADGWSVRFTGWHGSGDLTCLREANVLLFVPQGDGELAAGAVVEVTPLDGGRAGAVSFGVP